jgi:hypothetical protein
VTEHLVLRWSGQPDTVEQHQAIAAEHGTVWWGKWAKSADGRDPISAENREALADQIRAGEPTFAFLHNSQSEWRTRLVSVRDRSFRPPASLVPGYYPDSQPIDLWLELKDFERLRPGWMINHLVFARGTAEGEPVHFRGMNSTYIVSEPTDHPASQQTSAPVPPETLQPAPPVASPGWSQPTIQASQAFDLRWLEQTTLWTKQELLEVISAIRSRGQVILAGPPGTGKTWVAERLGHHLTGGRPSAVEMVQFHPTYSYEDFVEGLRPVAREGQVTFEVVEGALIRVAERARAADHPVVLVIDEMNRANLPSVMGELLYLLEYRCREIRLLHRSAFSLPENLYIIGTMNTADRSIRSVDTALRRRFEIFDCPPRSDVLAAYYDAKKGRTDVPHLAAGMDALNKQLADQLDRHHAVGHSFFMAEELTRQDLERIWRRQIAPLIEEYFFDQPDLVASFAVDSYWPANARSE